MNVKQNEKTTEEEMPKVAAATVTRERTLPETIIYVGPTIHNVVQANTVFNNGITESLKGKTKEWPVLNGLILPIRDLGRAKKELAIKGSELATLYAEVQTLQGGKA